MGIKCMMRFAVDANLIAECTYKRITIRQRIVKPRVLHLKLLATCGVGLLDEGSIFHEMSYLVLRLALRNCHASTPPFRLFELKYHRAIRHR